MSPIKENMKNLNQEKINQVSKISTKRDGYIDFFKGLLILWVIHIHTVFWSGRAYISDPFREASLLIDVTTFFFISGYLTKPAGLIDSFKRAFKQFKNLYLNYITISLLLLPALSLGYFLRKKLVPDLQQAIIFMMSVLKLEAPGDVWGVIPVYRGSAWYLWVYLSLLFALPFFISCFQSRKLRVVVLFSLLLLLHFSIQFSWNFDFLLTEAVYIYFYAFIYLLGMAYRLDGHLIRTHYFKLSFLINILVCLFIYFVLDNRIISLHAEKFPPSFKYLAYSLLLIHVLIIFQRIWHYPNSKDRYKAKALSFLEWCGKNSYFIFIFQGVVCSIPLYFTDFLLNRFSVPSTYVIFLVFNIIFTLLVTFFYLRVKLSFFKLIKTRQMKQV
ncbi:hypothetical protein STA3757_43200 [Stanieria sp. NIES-3757]|nr:hypothetical protein STA3757_43200 [Stanieria sp. NIES-3757]